jgi:type VI secretion system protein ImpI
MPVCYFCSFPGMDDSRRRPARWNARADGRRQARDQELESESGQNIDAPGTGNPPHEAVRHEAGESMLLVLTVVKQPEGCVVPEARRVFGAEGGTIGRSADNAWQLPDPRRFVSSMHGFIRCDGGRFFLVDTSTNGIFVNGDSRPIGPGRKVRLQEGDRINIGQYELLAEFDAAGVMRVTPPMTPGMRMAELAFPGDEDATLHKPPPRKDVDVAVSAAAVADQPSTMVGTQAVKGSAGPTDDLLAALGLDAGSMTPDMRSRFVENVAGWIRAATRGTQDVLGQRQALRQQMRIASTTLGAADNNPLRFSPTEQEAILHMFAPRGQAYLAGPAAIRDALSDVADHQKACATAMRAAFDHMLLCLDPRQLEQRFERGTGKPALLQSRKAFLWEMFEAQYREWSAQPEKAFDELFGDRFADKYQDCMEFADLSRER